MDVEKLAEKLKDLIVGEIKEELKDFKFYVSKELEVIGEKLSSLEEEIKEVKKIHRIYEYKD